MEYINKTKMRDILAKVKGKDTFNEMRFKLEWTYSEISMILSEKRIMSPNQFKDIRRVYDPSIEILNELLYKIILQVDEKTRERYLS